MQNKTAPFRLARPGMALGLLGCIFLFCLILAGIAIPIITQIAKRPEVAIRFAAIIQDLLIFIIPALGMAMVVTRLPARLLAVDIYPTAKSALLAIGVLLVSIPAMNVIIQWNQDWHLPAGMEQIETYFRALEDGAAATVDTLMAGSSIASLIVSILIVGVLAGFSEELFFRGALLRTLGMTRINHHVAIWFVAFIFSAFHFQLFGFIPRMLLGAFFGYALFWSKSLWLPIILHIFNNTLVVIAEYNKANSPSALDIDASDTLPTLDTVGSNLSSPLEISIAILSLTLTVGGLWLLRRQLLSTKQN